MDKLIHNKRLLLAGIIIITTLYISVQNHQARSDMEPATQRSNIAANQNDRNAPPTSFIWIVGSSLLGLVGLKRFGLNQG